MKLTNITKDIYYVGVNDRDSSLFEELWPLPNGVSYNSYIIKGEKEIALIDTVHAEFITSFIQKIKDVAGNLPVSYLIINHMEPDHSGCITEIVKEYPQIKIIGNKQTISMIKDFYHLENPELFKEVKDNDELNLVNKRLKFKMTPMVHWPETMMSYLEEEKILFSGDAFGMFGAIDGNIIDLPQQGNGKYDEMYRYYSNIVGKYGKFVQSALKKLEGLEIDYICPTHGPVWHKSIDEVIEIYNNLSAYKSEDGVTIIYGSMYGNTARLADKIAEELSDRGISNIKIHNASRTSVSEMISDCFRYKGIIIGSATYSMGIFPPVETLLKALQTREIKNKTLAIFGSFTWAKNAVIRQIHEYADNMKIPVVAELEMNRSLSGDLNEGIIKFAERFVEEYNDK